jgi:hypothetical protein
MREQQQTTFSRSDARSAPQLIDERLLLFRLRLKNVDKREEVGPFSRKEHICLLLSVARKRLSPLVPIPFGICTGDKSVGWNVTKIFSALANALIYNYNIFMEEQKERA